MENFSALDYVGCEDDSKAICRITLVEKLSCSLSFFFAPFGWSRPLLIRAAVLHDHHR